MKIWICSVFLLYSLSQQVFSEPLSAPKSNLAIVIDDLVNNMNGTKERIKLTEKLTISIMPFMPSTKRSC